MLQVSAKKSVTIVSGASETGKTTAALRALIALAKTGAVSAVFIFDPEGEYAQRLKIAACETETECDYTVGEGLIFVVFDPHTMFPGDMQSAFEWFCRWSFETASRLQGRCVLLLDEAWKYCDRRSIPESLALCVQTGRKRGLEMVFATQLPHLLNASILNEWTEWICFHLGEELCLDAVELRGFNRDEVKALRAGEFIALNQRTRGGLRGKVF